MQALSTLFEDDMNNNSYLFAQISHIFVKQTIRPGCCITLGPQLYRRTVVVNLTALNALN